MHSVMSKLGESVLACVPLLLTACLHICAPSPFARASLLAAASAVLSWTVATRPYRHVFGACAGWLFWAVRGSLLAAACPAGGHCDGTAYDDDDSPVRARMLTTVMLLAAALAASAPPIAASARSMRTAAALVALAAGSSWPSASPYTELSEALCRTSAFFIMFFIVEYKQACVSGLSVHVQIAYLLFAERSPAALGGLLHAAAMVVALLRSRV